MENERAYKNCAVQLYPFSDELVHERFEKSLLQPPWLFSHDYFKLINPPQTVKEEALPASNYKEKKIKLPESFICSLWMDNLFNSKYLFTLDSKRIEVIYPGQWNFEKGPDFKNARIRLERGEIIKGDVEIHNFASEWNSHGHQLNTEYNNVILHVFMWDNKGQMVQKKENALPLIQLELKKFLKKDVMELYSLMRLEEYPFSSANNQGRCADYLKKADENRLARLLDLAGEARLILKMTRLQKKIAGEDYNQLLYESIMESLGYKYSKLHFTHIANTATLKYIKSRTKLIPKEEKAAHIESIFFGVAGFLDYFGKKSASLDMETERYFSRLRGKWSLYKKDFITEKISFSHWSFSGVRPANYPYGRLAGISAFLAHYVEKDLIETIYPAIQVWLKKVSNKVKWQGMFNLFPEPENNFWANRYSPTGNNISLSHRLIGEKRLADIAINAFLPVLLSYAKQKESKSMEKVIYKVYNCFPLLSSNRITKFMEEFILGGVKNKKKIIKGAKRQQALHQIYIDCCESNQSACDNCRFYYIAKYLILQKPAATPG